MRRRIENNLLRVTTLVSWFIFAIVGILTYWVCINIYSLYNQHLWHEIAHSLSFWDSYSFWGMRWEVECLEYVACFSLLGLILGLGFIIFGYTMLFIGSNDNNRKKRYNIIVKERKK